MTAPERSYGACYFGGWRRSDGAGGGEPARELVLTLFAWPAEQDERLGAQVERWRS